MTIPWPGQPDASVGSDAGAQLSQGFQVMVRQLQSLERVISTQTAMLERAQNASSRFQMAGQPQMRQDILQQVAGSGGLPSGARVTQVSGMGALTSLQNLRAYGAQALGQWIAGTPLFEPPSARGGGTPVGQPTSAGQAPGSGAPPPASPVAPVGPGGGAPPGGNPPGPPAQPGGTGAPGGGALPRGQQGTVLQQVGARVAMSGGSLSGIGNALRSIPGVGLVIDTANSATNFYLNQREAGRVYQEIEGGSNLGAQTERLHALAYQASMYGRVPSGVAGQMFGAVTAMGYNQSAVGEGQSLQNRQSALNFMYHNYTATGMDMSQSLQVLRTASQDANVDLTTLSSTLNTLSSAAGQAGANAKTARDQFNAYFASALGQGMGNGAQTVAGGIAAMQGSMGKEFSGVNFSGELSQGRQYLLSGMSGISPSALQYTARNNPGAYNKLLAGQNMQFLSQGGLMTPQMQSSLNQMIAHAGGGSALMANPTLRDQVATQFLNQWQLKGNINQDLWAQEISAMTGIQMNATQAFQWIVSQSAGVNEASHNTGLGATRNPGANVSAGSTKGAPSGRYGLAQGANANLAEEIFSFGITGQGYSWQQNLQQANGPAAAAYLSAEGKSRQRSPVLEALLQNTSPDTQVMVQTASGARVMSIADAMKYYPNELASGSVQFYTSGGQSLGSTANITHGLVNASASVAAEEKQRAGSNAGVTSAAWAKAHPNSVTPAAGGQAVTVSLSAEAAQLLKLLPSNSDTAAATSTVPANPYASQASR